MAATQSSLEASRAAVRTYLTHQIGLGNTFTMLALRAAIPNVGQIDRRMRELRAAEPERWIIHSSQSDRSLPVDAYRIDRIGGDRIPKAVSARVRREVLEQAGNRCQVCGIGVGEAYVDFPGDVARMQLGHWQPIDQGGSRTARGNLRAECHRCNGGIGNRTGAVVTAKSIDARVRALPRKSQDRLSRWLEQNSRDESEEERLFYEARQLPPSELARLRLDLKAAAAGGK